MSPDQQRIAELEKQVKDIQDVLLSLTNAGQINPLVARAFSSVIIKGSAGDVTDYDKSVSEGGLSSYTVAKVPDGLFEINGKIVGYYNPV